MRKLQWKGQNVCRLFSFKRKQLLFRSGVSGNNFQEHSALSGVWFLLESAHMPILGDFPLFIPIEQSSSLSLIYIVVAGEMAEARLIEQADDENFRLSANKRKPNHPHQPSWETLQFLFHKRCSSHYCGIKSKTTNYPVCDCCHNLKCF